MHGCVQSHRIVVVSSARAGAATAPHAATARERATDATMAVGRASRVDDDDDDDDDGAADATTTRARAREAPRVARVGAVTRAVDDGAIVANGMTVGE